MPKTLFIMRHAQAMPSAASDKERTLTPKGKEDARALGHYMKKQNHAIDLIYCSSALRTRQSWEQISGVLYKTKPEDNEQSAGHTFQYEEQDGLYNADSEKILRHIQNAPASCQGLMIVAHNPGIHQLCFTLARNAGERFLGRLSSKFEPGTLAVFSCDLDDWSDITENNVKITDLVDPLDYNAPATPARWT